MSAPPTTGPIASASAETPAQVPIALPRSSGGNVLEMIERVARHHERGADALDARPATSQCLVGARPIARAREREHDDAEEEHPAAAEDVAEPAARDEQDGEGQRVGVDGPLERRRATRRRSLWIDGSATFTTVLSSMIMNSAKHMARERPPAAVVLVQADAGGHDAALSTIGRSAAARASRSAGSRPSARSADAGDADARRAGRRCGGPRAVRSTRLQRRSRGSSSRLTSPRLTSASTARLTAGRERPSRSDERLTVSGASALAQDARGVLTCVKERPRSSTRGEEVRPVPVRRCFISAPRSSATAPCVGVRCLRGRDRCLHASKYFT